jgi:catechol 2,3-dioxygenase-like lactoylglutathione lyase family enzyme
VQFTLEHIGLAARDPAALKGWYERVLGATVAFANGATPPAFLLRLPAGLLLEIYPAASHRPETADNTLAGLRHLALRVPSIEAAQSALAAHGVAFPDPIKPAGGGGRVLFFQDPEGNLLHLVERPADSPLA